MKAPDLPVVSITGAAGAAPRVGRSYRAAALLVEPDIHQPAAVVDDLVRNEVLDVALVGEAVHAPAHGGPRRVLLQLRLDLRHEGHALFGIELLRLLLDHLRHLLVAVV